MTVHLEVLSGVELRDEGFRFRFPSHWLRRITRRCAQRSSHATGEMELPASEFGDSILPRFREDASSLHEVGFEMSVLHQLSLDEIGSPSHSIRVRQGPAEPTRVALAPEKDVPNRDLVLDVRFKERKARPRCWPDPPALGSDRSRLSSPPRFLPHAERPRRTAILLDRSGSMQGEPIAQARKAIESCLAALSEQDAFLLVALNDRVEAMHSELVTATLEQRESYPPATGNGDRHQPDAEQTQCGWFRDRAEIQIA